ncbi:MAG TPA: type I 3-dehydroquinate dehydratase [Verrucomicrobiae bacterium]|nr:type I 3-dehydroquinate dehydratase [Verrucomicrobiae bacterium]
MPVQQTHFGSLILGLAPQIVGTVSQADTLTRLAVGVERVCDIVEIRLDLIGSTDPAWLDHAKRIEAQGFPVVVTIRTEGEGGQWTQADAARRSLFETVLKNLSAADIELRSPLLSEISALARQHKRALIVSFHDFTRTPPINELRQIAWKAATHGTVVKIATFTQTEADLAALRELLLEKSPASLCVLGMGPLGPRTRLEFPKFGSCLSYGYLDMPVAPGQVSARELWQQLHRK